jgi:hypothetical protein
MDSRSLDECIALIRNGKKIEARKPLQDILQSDLQNLNGWYWYVETFDTPEQKLKALRLCLKYNPENQIVKDAIKTFEKKLSLTVKNASVNKPTSPKNQNPGSKKSNKNLLILGIVLGIGVVGLICVLAIGILLSNQAPTTVSTPKPTVAPTRTSTPKPFTGKWQVSTKKSEFDNSTTVTLALEAEKYVEGWLTTTLPYLVLRCKEREMDVYVNVGMQSNVEYGRYDSVTVRVRFDQNQAFEMIADESTDGEALFFRDPYGMIMAMLQSKEMVFGFTPLNAAPAVTTFDLRGLANIIEPLKQSCNWNGERPTIAPFPTLEPTATSTNTPTPLPPGSALTISGITAGNWTVKIEKVIVTKSVSSYGNTTKAGGQFVLVFLQITNLGNDPDTFAGGLNVKDLEGNLFSSEIVASIQASDTYGVPYGTMIQPGDSTTRLLAFDLPLNSAFYFLVPGILADDNGQSVILEIPKQ